MTNFSIITSPGKTFIKVGTHRIDGAIAALTPLGFSKRLICHTIRTLVKVYGDNDAGWYFVEENYYKLVIDKIIEDQEEKMKHQDAEAKPIPLLEAGPTESSQPPLLQLEANSSSITDIPSSAKPLKSEGLCGGISSSPSVRRPCYGWISEEEE